MPTKIAGVTDRKFGIEIECFGLAHPEGLVRAISDAGIAIREEQYNHTTRQHWKIVTDGSISGDRNPDHMNWITYEVVSPPMRFPEATNATRKVCRVLQALGTKVNRTCGLHVHHNASDFDLNAIKSLYNLIYRYENVLFGLVAPSRRGNGYCLSLEDQNRINTARSITGLQRYIPSREHGLNLSAMYRHMGRETGRLGTIEFRYHQGTVDAEMILW
jgi:hypothetical protein